VVKSGKISDCYAIHNNKTRRNTDFSSSDMSIYRGLPYITTHNHHFTYKSIIIYTILELFGNIRDFIASFPHFTPQNIKTQTKKLTI
jgi:hypothetical protein